MTDAELAALAFEHNVTLDDIVRENPNLTFFRESDNGGHQYYFLDEVEQIVLATPTDNDADYVAFREGEVVFDSRADTNREMDQLVLDNSLLDVQVNTESNTNNNSFSDSDGWETGSLIHEGDYQVDAPIYLLNGDGLNNQLAFSIPGDDYRTGNAELVDTNHSEQIDYNFNILDDLLDFSIEEDYSFTEPQEDFTFDFSSIYEEPREVNPFDVFSSGVQYLTNLFLSAPETQNVDPLIIDLDGDGVELISYQNSIASFDVDNDGYKESTGWVHRDDAIIVHDLNGDGIINDITETISEYYGAELGEQLFADGLEALESLDSNDDGVFDAADDLFSTLKVWQDANENGITDAGELYSLDEKNIASFDLANIEQVDRERIEGNPVLSRSTATFTDGVVRDVAAVDFTTNEIGYEWNTYYDGFEVSTEDGASSSFFISDLNGLDVSTADKGVNSLYGNIGDDTLRGDAGNNWLFGGLGNDAIYAGAGDDLIAIDGDDNLANIDAGEGIDVIRVVGDDNIFINLSAVNAEVFNGGGGDDIVIGGGVSNVFINGGDGDDLIIGGAADDALAGEDGDDIIDGGYGDDVIRGHRGVDDLKGNAGNDLIYGGLGDDILRGNAGNDVLQGDEGSDEIDGGEGFDLAVYNKDYDQYTIASTSTGYDITDVATGDTDHLTSIEKLRFANININFDELGVDSPPLPVADNVSVSSFANTITIDAASLISNDISFAGEQLSINSVSDAVGGTVSLNSMGNVVFVPDAYFIGTRSFDYVVQNEAGNTVSVYRSNDPDNAVSLKAQVNLISDEDPTDPLFYDQWYLSETRVAGAWQDYTGEGVTIGIFEGDYANPFNHTHNDLNDNVIGEYLAGIYADDIDSYSNHSTLVAGVIAAEKNGEGAIGIAYNANIASHSWSATEAEGLRNLQNYDVANNSWGRTNPFTDDFSNNNISEKNTERFLKNAIEYGREGLGTAVVFAGGNDRAEGYDTNNFRTNSNKYSIVTGSINQEGDLSTLVETADPFSNPGASILVSAPGSNIVSTANLLENENGSTFGNDFESTQGTSFSAPIVSGIVALMLEANPNLGYRDIQTILAYTARFFADDDSDWQNNHANNVNGGGLHFSHDYGFGIVDAHAAVRLAEVWTEINNEHNEAVISVLNSLSPVIGDNATVLSTISITDTINVENVEISVDIDHGRIGDLIVTLISPDGTRSRLVNRPGKAPGSDDSDVGLEQENLIFTLNSTNNWGEQSNGLWRLEIQDALAGQTGILNSWSINIYGSSVDDNDNYVFTSDFGVNDSGNRILNDNLGTNIINAATLLKNSIINLNAGTDSTINDITLSLSSTSIFHNAYGGDGDDIIIGNAENNILSDGRGSDILTGGAGSDVFKIKAQNNTIDTITDFSLTNDVVDIGDFNINNFADLAISQEGNHSVISFTGGQRIILQNVSQSSLNANNFEGFLETVNNIVGTASNDNLFGTAADDVITGGAGNDILNGKTGDNILTGGTRADTFFISKNAEHTDTITDFFSYDYNERIILSKFTEIRDFSDLVLSERDSGVEIDLGNNQLLFLENTNISNLSRDNFIFYKQEVGSDDIDYIYTNDRVDNIFAGGGDDEIVSGSASDYIHAGDGDDLVEAGYGNDVVRGGWGDDTIFGEVGDDLLYGGLGDDSIVGGISSLSEETGDGNNEIYGNGGDDTIYGENGIDRVFGGSDNDNIYGNGGNDYLRGEEGNDNIIAGDGNDDADGGEGHDFILGGAGNDVLSGGEGDDFLQGEVGDDIIIGGAGNDVIQGNVGNNILTGGLDRDEFIIDDNYGNQDIITDFNLTEDHIDLFSLANVEDFSELVITQQNGDSLITLNNDLTLGSQTILIRDTIASDLTREHFITRNNAPTVTGNITDKHGFVNDSFTFTIPSATFSDDDVGDSLTYIATLEDGSALPSWMTFDPNTFTFSGTADASVYQDSIKVTATDSYGASTSVSFSFEILAGSVIVGTSQNDLRNGTTGDDNIRVGFGNDYVFGFNGDDIIYGEYGNDYLSGDGFGNYDSSTGNISVTNEDSQVGNDIIYGGWGDDIIFGDRGDDTLYGGQGDDTIVGGISSTAEDSDDDNNEIYGDEGDDIIYGANGIDIISGGRDDDIIRAFAGDDMVYGDAGNDYIEGNLGDDIIYGGEGDDEIYGNEGDDIIYDGAGADLVRGGDGNDIIYIEGGNGVNLNNATIDSAFLGQSGDDTFILRDNTNSFSFFSSNITNLIYDFEVNNINEKIDLSYYTSLRNISDLGFTNINIADDNSILEGFFYNIDNSYRSFSLFNIDEENLTNDNFIFLDDDAPVAVDDNFSVSEDNNLIITRDALLANDFDSEDGVVTFDRIFRNPLHGSLTQNIDGDYIYTPNANYHGEDSFLYAVSDSNGAVRFATVTIDVDSINDIPTIQNITNSNIDEDNILNINPLSGSNDVDGDFLTITSVTQGSNGIV